MNNHSKFRRPQWKLAPAGFTVVELLLVITIIAILSSLSLAVIRSAQDDAKHAATETRITQIRAILQQRMEDYEVRKLPIRLTSYSRNRSILQALKNLILIDVVSVEMPRETEHVNRFPSDELQQSINNLVDRGDFTQSSADSLIMELQNPRYLPALARRFSQGTNSEALRAHYLFRVLETTDFDGVPGTESLGNSAFADTDGDGLMEVVDSWGNPMTFDIIFFDDNGEETDIPTVFEQPGNQQGGIVVPPTVSELTFELGSEHDHE